MAGELVFITGATGHVGFAVLLEALKQGYSVRVSIREGTQHERLENHELLKPYKPKIEYVVVPDITAEGAFDHDILKDVVYIEHIASPIPAPTDNPERDIMLPAIKGTENILFSALKIPSIRRVVITSSAVAIMPIWATAKGDSENTYTPDSRVDPLPTAPFGDFSLAYRSAKTLALAATDRILADANPHFTIVNILPGYVIGPNRLVVESSKVASGSNALVMAVLTGRNPGGIRPCTISDLRDVARVHVEALSEAKVKGNRSFFVQASPGAHFDQAADFVKKHFPNEVRDGVFPLGGSVDCVFQNIDGSDTAKVFGELRTFEDAVQNLVAYYLELKSKEQTT